MKDLLLVALVALYGCNDGTSKDTGADATIPPDTTKTGGGPPGSGDTPGEGGPTDTGPTERFHPDDYARASVHGPPTLLQTDGDCRDCHGADLEGGTSGVSCSSCHEVGWEAECTYCHGGIETSEGAPPRDIDGNTDITQSPFQPHTAHVDGQRHGSLGCTECHAQPTDALTPGHLFDDATPGVAEVVFTAGLSPAATWSGGTCANLYCHGNGQMTADIDHTSPTPSCSGCHPDINSGSNEWDSMSGDHELHISHDMLCSECHGGTVDDQQDIVGASLHVNGTPDVVMDPSITWDGTTCTGDCHGEGHNGRSW